MIYTARLIREGHTMVEVRNGRRSYGLGRARIEKWDTPDWKVDIREYWDTLGERTAKAIEEALQAKIIDWDGTSPIDVTVQVEVETCKPKKKSSQLSQN